MSILRSLQSLYTQVYAYEDQIGAMHRVPVVSRPLVTTTWTVVPPLILGPQVRAPARWVTHLH
jgi:hypothetical protein